MVLFDAYSLFVEKELVAVQNVIFRCLSIGMEESFTFSDGTW